MVSTIRDLLQHQAWADAAILRAVRADAGASGDAEIRKTLHHIVVVQRYFLSLLLERPFDAATEMRIPDTLDELERRFREIHAEELSFGVTMNEAALERSISVPVLQMPLKAGVWQPFQD